MTQNEIEICYSKRKLNLVEKKTKPGNTDCRKQGCSAVVLSEAKEQPPCASERE